MAPKCNSPSTGQARHQENPRDHWVLLYYARQVDPTMLVTIGTIAAAQSKGTEATVKAVEYLLDYCISHSNRTIRYTPSNMLLKVHSDALYLSVPKA
eukprot:13483385-Ditylum_brightwellii.AAC.1